MAVSSSPFELKVVEFYAGVGGWHFALKHSNIQARVVAAIDINTNANKVYRHNFPTTTHLQRNICGLTSQDLDSFSADVFTLSPPCQPFTRQGKQGDNTDHRTDSFFHLMHILPEMTNPPQYLMMENVNGFECSKTRDHFRSMLVQMNYDTQEFLLSPKQFGIPNSRLRYYLLARRKPMSFSSVLPSIPCLTLEDCLRQFLPTDTMLSTTRVPIHLAGGSTSTDAHVTNPETIQLSDGKQAAAINVPKIKSLKDGFLEALTDSELSEFFVSDKILDSYAMGLDIVDADSTGSCCFTKGYFRYAVGTGSVVKHDFNSSLDVAFKEYLDSKEKVGVKGSAQCLKSLQLRYFTPREVSNLMCFPKSFEFPPDMTLKQKYGVLGNSVNVLVVSVLLQYLLTCKK